MCMHFKTSSGLNKPMIIQRIFLLAGIFAVGISGQLEGQHSEPADPLVIQKIQGEFRFDGVVDDPCWTNATLLPMVMQSPVFGQPPSEKTEIMITYDNTFIYVGGRMYDRSPDKIMYTSRLRDELTPQNDWFAVTFDSFNDKENGLCFATTPAGIRLDMAILNDATDVEKPLSKDWNTFWDVKTSITDDGWFTELKIPFSSLRFQSHNEKVTMGMISFRYLPRDTLEIDIFPAIPNNWGGNSWLKVSQAREIVFEGIQPRKPFYIAPYLIGGMIQESRLNDAGTTRELHTEPEVNAGLDVKYGLTENLTLDLSVNTDFAQVEADNAQLNLTRFSLFFPEKRTFFLERTSNFSFAFDESNNLFYSRRIGLANDEFPVPIYGGARLVGRTGKMDIGLLDMQTHPFDHPDDTTKNLSSENFGILRLRRQVFNQNSYAGGIITSRLGADGTYNTAYGLDGIFRLQGDNYLDIKWAQTFDDAYHNKIGALDNSRVWIDLCNRKALGFGYDVFMGRAGENYRPDVGFEQRENYYLLGTKLLYGWRPGAESPIDRHKFLLNAKQWNENKNNNLQTFLASAGYALFLKSGASLNLLINHNIEQIQDTFQILGTGDVIPGKYSFTGLDMMINSPYSWKLFLMARVQAGEYYGGNQFSIFLSPIYSPGPGFRLELMYGYDRVRFPAESETCEGHIAGLRTSFMFSNKLSAIAFVQYNNVDDAVITNLRFRYNPKEGNDFYLVFNEGRNTFPGREDPPLQQIESRSILVKYTYTFVL